MGGLRDKLLTPDLIGEFIAEFYRQVEADRQQSQVARTTSEARLIKVNRSISNLISAIKEGLYQPSMKSELEVLEAEKAALTFSLAEQPPLSPYPCTRRSLMFTGRRCRY